MVETPARLGRLPESNSLKLSQTNSRMSTLSSNCKLPGQGTQMRIDQSNNFLVLVQHQTLSNFIHAVWIFVV